MTELPICASTGCVLEIGSPGLYCSIPMGRTSQRLLGCPIPDGYRVLNDVCLHNTYYRKLRVDLLACDGFAALLPGVDQDATPVPEPTPSCDGCLARDLGVRDRVDLTCCVRVCVRCGGGSGSASRPSSGIDSISSTHRHAHTRKCLRVREGTRGYAPGVRSQSVLGELVVGGSSAVFRRW